MDNSNNATAIELADKIRREHNGVFQVTLYLGHDGNNVCCFGDYESNVGKGESGVSLLDAVSRACGDWRFRNLTTSSWGEKTVMDCIEMAIKDFGGTDGIFNTAGFYQAVNSPDAYALLTDVQTRRILENHPRVVRLSGGAHWLLLPGAHTRFAPNEARTNTEASVSSPG